MGGPNSAETDGPGGTLSAGNQIFRYRLRTIKLVFVRLAQARAEIRCYLSLFMPTIYHSMRRVKMPLRSDTWRSVYLALLLSCSRGIYRAPAYNAYVHVMWLANVQLVYVGLAPTSHVVG